MESTESLTTAGRQHSLEVPSKPDGFGSSVNGGELFLALATCYCNDLYREAKKRGIEVETVQVGIQTRLRRFRIFRAGYPKSFSFSARP